MTKLATINILVITLLFAQTSCKKWLDVKPKSQISSDDNFKTEQGFKDALTGVYIQMARPGLYGQEMTWGYVDVLAKQYTEYSSSQTAYAQMMDWRYGTTESMQKVAGIWKDMYHAIAGLNNLLDNLGKADKSIFTASNYNLIKGEALGLRAYLHFDLLRLFGPSPKDAGGLSALSIPFRDEVSAASFPRLPISELLSRIQSDLNEASGLLETVDPIKKNATLVDQATKDRKLKFNYYAAQLLKARVFLYAGEYQQAFQAADAAIAEVQAAKFPFTPVSQVVNGNRMFGTEVIFNLDINNLPQVINSNFIVEGASNTVMAKSNALMRAVFDVSANAANASDYRFQYWTIASSNTTSKGTVIKLYPTLNTQADVSKRYPLLRVSELYYIAAESCFRIPGKEAEGEYYLNQVRINRGLTVLPTGLNTDQLLNEVFKEYRKEFLMEGQLFYYYKRLRMGQIWTTAAQTVDPVIYQVPLPDDEIEYGLN